MSDTELRTLPLLYDTLRTARLNERYYFTRAKRLRQMDIIIDLYIALCSLALAVFAVGFLYVDRSVTAILAVQISVVALAKPITRSSERIGQAMYLARAYGRIQSTLREMADRVTLTHQIGFRDRRNLENLTRELRSLSGQDDPRPSPRVIQQLQKEVNEELPASLFWWPSDDPASVRGS